ncbi:MAG TPA: immunoglobulin domain-containing protein, partial [Bacillota bacterium]|nr:immunoglobulin domain-containing protein [Bacillota bacterium]
NYSVTSPLITTQPASQTVKETMAAASFGITALGAQPLTYQWRFNGTDIPGATSSVLTLSNVTASMAGTYNVLVANTYGSALSSNALLTVTPVLNTAQMTNLWNLLPGDRSYLTVNSTERGLAYNRTTKNLLLVSRSPSESVVVLDPATGAEKRFLDVTGIPGSIANVSLGLNQIGVADDGAIFGGGVSVVASTTPLYIYRWANDGAGNYPVSVFSGDPAGGLEPGLRWGDNLAVRGAGANTQILLAPASGTNVVLLRTAVGSSEFDFQYAVPPAVIAVSGVPSGFAALGVAFGPGANTFWAKNASNALYLVQFDLAANTGTVLYAYTNPATLTPVRGIATDANQKWLAGVALDNPDSVNLYDISDLAAGPVLRDQELFTVKNANGTAGGTAAAAFGDDYLFVLDTNNGIKAFKIDPNYVPALPAFKITGVVLRNGSDLILNWPSVSGHTYQVQAKDVVSGGSWSNLGGPLAGTGATLSFTNNTSSATTKFYRIVGQ